MVSSKIREFIEQGLIEKSKKSEPKKLAREDIDLNKIPDMLIDIPPSPPPPPPPVVATSSRRKEKSIYSIVNATPLVDNDDDEEEEEEEDEEYVPSDEEYVPSPKVKEHKVCKQNIKRLDVIQATEAPSRSNNNIDKGKGKTGRCRRKKKETNIPPPPPVSGSGDSGSGGTNTNVAQVQVTTETAGGTNNDITTVVNERVHPIWFSLVACEKQEGHSPLPQISTRYIKIKDANKPSSYIKKYLAHKLSLQSEDEVELRMLGMPIRPDLPIKDLEKLWLRVAPHSGKSSVKVGSSAEELVMVLKYSRSHPKLN
uniref:Ring finger protein n=2 Tax=Solanum tuberosum TaxID=4113 RepID=M1DDJ0_SOLTU